MSAELSLPSEITKSGLFAGFIERIFVSIGRDIEGSNNSDNSTEEDYNDDFKITKKDNLE